MSFEKKKKCAHRAHLQLRSISWGDETLTDTHTPTVAEGRQIRSAEVAISELDKFARTVEDVYDNKLDALMIRNAFPAEIAATVTERIRTFPG